MVSLAEIDEVHLGLVEAAGAFERDSHRPNPNPASCHACYAYYLVQNALHVYYVRHNLKGGNINHEID